MKDPKTLLEAIQYFSDEQVCIDAVAMMRWPQGVRCGFCDTDKPCQSEALEVPLMPQAVLRQGQLDLRGLSHFSQEVVTCSLADCELQEWHL